MVSKAEVGICRNRKKKGGILGRERNRKATTDGGQRRISQHNVEGGGMVGFREKQKAHED